MVYVMACYFIAEIYLKRQTLGKGLCFRLKGIVISFSHLNNLISCLNSFLENYSLIVSVRVYFISNDLMLINMPIMVSRKGRASFQNRLVPHKNLKHFTCPVCFAF